MAKANGEIRKIPLEEIILPWKDTDGLEMDIPALDKRWCQKLTNVGRYYTLEENVSLVVVETWRQAVSALVDTCEFLLGLPYHKFWSQVVFDRDIHGDDGVQEAIDMYLHRSPRYIEPEIMNAMWFEKLVLPTQKKLHTYILRIMARMATNREKKDDFMSKAYYCELIPKYKLFSVHRIMDICSLYGPDNEVVKPMMENVLKSMPIFLTDLEENFKAVLEIMKRCEAEMEGSAGECMRILRRKETDFDRTLITCAITFSVDIVYSLTNLIKHAPASTLAMHRVGMEQKLVHFYHVIYPCGRRALSSNTGGFGFGNTESLSGRLQYFQSMLFQLCTTLLEESCLKPLSRGKSNETDRNRDEESFEKYLSIRRGFLQKAQTQKFPFGGIFESMRPIKDDLDKFREKNLTLPKEEEEELREQHLRAKCKVGVDAWFYLYEAQPQLLNRIPLAEAIPKKQMAVLAVKDIFPNLSDGFLLTCASHYKYNQEKLLDALITNELPQYLKYYRLIADREESPEVMELFQKWVGSKRDIPDDFTVESLRVRFRQATVDEPSSSGIHQATSSGAAAAREETEAPGVSAEREEEYLRKIAEGKKHGGLNWTDKNRKEVSDLKKFYQKFEEETPDPDEEEAEARMYDDEYDDTYDGMADYGGADDGGNYQKKRQVVGGPPGRGFGGISDGAGPSSAYPGFRSADPSTGVPHTQLAEKWMNDGTKAESSSKTFETYNFNRGGSSTEQPYGAGGRVEIGGPENRDIFQDSGVEAVNPAGQRGRGRGGPPRGNTTYTGGIQRQRKEQRGAHNQKGRARSKYSRGMF